MENVDISLFKSLPGCTEADLAHIQKLLGSLKEKDFAEYEHTLRVKAIVDQILTQYDDMAEADKLLISLASLLHDIGKLEISDTILKKQGRLDFDEYEEVKSHVTTCEPLLKSLSFYQKIFSLIRSHHENINGFGYPDGIESDEIPLGSKIIHIAEAYDAMQHPRTTQKAAVSRPQILKEFEEYANRIYDEGVLNQFFKIVNTIPNKEESPV